MVMSIENIRREKKLPYSDIALPYVIVAEDAFSLNYNVFKNSSIIDAMQNENG